jgi:hypothetical protein
VFISVLAAVYGAIRDYEKTRHVKKRIDSQVTKIIAALKEQVNKKNTKISSLMSIFV